MSYLSKEQGFELKFASKYKAIVINATGTPSFRFLHLNSDIS
jgi:hypothetical protein